MNKDWRTNSTYAMMFYECDSINRRKNIENFLLGLYPSSIDESKARLIRGVDKLYLDITGEKYTTIVADYKVKKIMKYRAS